MMQACEISGDFNEFLPNREIIKVQIAAYHLEHVDILSSLLLGFDHNSLCTVTEELHRQSTRSGERWQRFVVGLLFGHGPLWRQVGSVSGGTG